MANTNELVLKITVDEKDANKAIVQFNGNLGNIERMAIKGGNGASKAIDSVTASAKQAVNQLRALAGISLAGVASWAVKTSADFERSRIGLQAFLGDAKAADSLFRELQDFAEKSPFEFKDLLEGTNRLMAFNFSAKDILPTLKAVSAAGGALGFDSGKLNDLLVALGQIKAAGRLTGEEMRQLRNAGVPALDFLAKAFGKTTAEIEGMIRKGLVPADAAIKALVDGMRDRFGKFDDAVSRTTSVALSNFRDSISRVADDLIRDYLPKITETLNKTREALDAASKAAKENRPAIENTASALYKIVSFAAGYRLVTWLATAAAKAKDLGAVLVGSFNPVALVLGVIVAMLPQIIDFFQKLKKDWNEDQFLTTLRGTFGMKDIEAAARANADRLGPKAPAEAYVKGVTSAGGVPVDDNGLGEAIVKAQRAATERSTRDLERARNKSLEGLKLWRSEAAEMTRELSQVTDDKGQVHRIQLNAEARANIEKIVAAKMNADLAELAKKNSEEKLRIAMEAGARDAEAFMEAERRKQEYGNQIAEEMQRLGELRIERSYAAEQAVAQRQRDAALLDIEAANAQTIEQKLAVEDRKLGVESDYAKKALDIQLRRIESEKQAEVAKWKLKASLAGKDLEAEEVKGYLRQIEDGYDGEIRSVKDAAAAEDLQRAKQTEMAKGRIVIDKNREIYESLKQQAGGVFDAMLTKSQSVFGAIGNAFKTAILTAIKEIVTSRVAAALMQLMGGGRVSFAGAGGGGAFGGLGGLLGMGVPVFAGGAPGGTPPIIAPQATAGSGGGLAAAGGWAGLAGGWKGSLASLGNIGMPSGSGGVWGSSANSGWFGGKGTGGVKGGAMLAGGAILAMDGLRRGGVAGLGETVAGGALIGAKFGGPLGAWIGAGIGAVAGLVRLFVKGAQEKAREKIRATYGIDIKDKGILKQIVDMARQSYGSNLDAAIRGSDVRELIELYALSTGQGANRLPAAMKPVGLVQQGRTLFIQSLAAGGSAPRLDSIQSSAASNSGPVVIQSLTLQVDGQSAADLMEGRIADNPRLVQSAVLSATKSNFGRREMAAQTFSPGLLTA